MGDAMKKPRLARIIQGFVHQLLIGIDQLGNVFLYSSHDDRFGMADETISARAWRLERKSVMWKAARICIDGIFFWQKKHCYGAYMRERLRGHMPEEYK